MPHNSSYSNRGTIKKRATPDSTTIRPLPRVLNDRFTGFGMIQPGAKPEREIPPLGNPFKQIGDFFKTITKKKAK